MDELISRAKMGFSNPTNRPSRDSAEHLKDAQGIQVAVVSNGGTLQELYIPHDSDGIYKIIEQNGKEVLLQIRKQDDEWIALCGSKARFTDASKFGSSRSAVLTNHALFHLTGSDGGYYLYVEDVNTEARVHHSYSVEKGRPITIGRSADCGIVINSDFVSRHHAIISWDEKGWRIQDTNSTNGIFVNGKKIQDASLNYGDGSV